MEVVVWLVFPKTGLLFLLYRMLLPIFLHPSVEKWLLSQASPRCFAQPWSLTDNSGLTNFHRAQSVLKFYSLHLE